MAGFHKPLAYLRHAAEKSLRDVRANQADRALHELQVHQIELEMQNESLRQTQIHLEAARDRYLRLYEFASVGCLTLADTGLIQEANLMAADILGIERDQLLRSRFEKLVAPNDRDRWRRIFQLVVKQCATRTDELQLLGGTGHPILVRVDSRLTVDECKVDEVLLTITDITESKRYEDRLIASEQRYLALFRDASDAIAIADAKDCLEEVNRNFATLLGYTEEELRGMPIAKLHPPEELPKVLRHVNGVVRFSLVAPLETRVVRKDGRLLEVEIRPAPIEIGGRRVWQGIFIDLCERRQRERERIREETEHRTTLVREVHHRIKNHLQSVVGLLRRELGRFVDLDPRLKVAISQVNAIAVVHGLQATDADDAILLCDSVRNICAMVSDISRRPVLFHIEDEHTAFLRVRVDSTAAVSVALVLNELILNAVKHSPDDSDAPSVSLSANGFVATVAIRNAVTGAPTFDFKTDVNLGTGLRLVRSLLPVQGAKLIYQWDKSGVMHTLLEFMNPVLVTRQMQEADPS